MTRWFSVGVAWLMLVSVAWAAPHQELNITRKSATATSAQTDAALWTPDTGKRFILNGCLICADSPISVELEVSDVDVVPPVYLESYGCKTVGTGVVPVYQSDKDAVLTYTSAALTGPFTSPYGHRNVSVMCWGYESE